MLFPAHAGMDRGRPARRRAQNPVPRTRGDGPLFLRFGKGLLQLFPAQAGMDRRPPAPAPAPAPAPVPRTRGDGPGAPVNVGQVRWLFPAHAGMDRRWWIVSRPCWSLFPAHAGMDRAPSLPSGQSSACSPHTRGWTELKDHFLTYCTTCSPHTRGWTDDHHHRQDPTQAVPRTRGDGPVATRRGQDAGELFPAHAGMDRRRFGFELRVQNCSPHTRGWTVSRRASRFRRPCCSPHTRGWTVAARAKASPQMLFPAHAGMDRRLCAAPRGHIACSPHTRGWTAGGPLPGLAMQACSPHTRGWTVSDAAAAALNSLFPAHAGMDRGRLQSAAADG